MDLITLFKRAKYRLMKTGHQPPLLVVSFADHHRIAEIMWSSTTLITPSERQQIAYLAGQKLARLYGPHPLARIWVVSEGWMSPADPQATRIVSPSEDPNRQEVLLIVELDVSEEMLPQRIELGTIRRSAAGIVLGVDPLPANESAEDSSDRLIGALALAFLAGFAQASGDRATYMLALRHIYWHNRQMER